jgi:hypothetical protein
MSSSVDADYSDLVQSAELGRKLQDLIGSLVVYFSIESVPEKDGWSKVECPSEELDKVKEEFTEEFERSEDVSAKISQKGNRG